MPRHLSRQSDRSRQLGSLRYDYSDWHIPSFSHLHRGSSGGTGIHDRAGIISIVPFTGEKTDTFFINPVLEIDKTSEFAKAGYYAVTLTEDHIKAELTATQNVGMHRYTFPEGSDGKIFLNTGNRSLGMISSLKDEHTIEGSVDGFYFVLKSNTPITTTTVWENDTIIAGDALNGIVGNGIVCDFNQTSEEIRFKVGISFTGLEAAYENMEHDCPGWDFDQVKEDAFAEWNKVLGSIEVEGKNEEDKIIFYTALYHSCFLPVVYSDVSGTSPDWIAIHTRLKGTNIWRVCFLGFIPHQISALQLISTFGIQRYCCFSSRSVYAGRQLGSLS